MSVPGMTTWRADPWQGVPHAVAQVERTRIAAERDLGEAPLARERILLGGERTKASSAASSRFRRQITGGGTGIV